MKSVEICMVAIATFGLLCGLPNGTPSDSAAEPINGESGSDGVLRVKLLPAKPGNPRNSEGDFILLSDGGLAFVYTHFTQGAGDHAGAHLAARFSADDGHSWSGDDVLVLPNEAQMNVMSVSLLRLQDGRIALFYLRKNSLTDCRPYLRTSGDEMQSWSEPVEIIGGNEIGYYVLNNDRVVQLSSGRLVVPVAQHQGPGQEKWTGRARILCYLSDDSGASWRRAEQTPIAKESGNKKVTLQEPGVVQLADGRLIIFCRTDAGSQFVAYSSDGGESWSGLQASNIVSPLSPASIERIPGTAKLFLVWNDHRDISPELRGKRTPLRIAVSDDSGRTWIQTKTVESNPHGWFCYTAVEFVGDHVLLGHCAGDRRHNNGLAETQITRIPLDWFNR